MFADGQCCVKQDDREVRISIEDLAWAVIDTPQATLASALMAACMEAGVAIVLATRHTPSGLVLPFHRHHRQSVIARLRTDAKDSLKKRLRQEMVRRKILNQSAVLVAVGSDGAATPKEIARHVEPRDPDNIEARAARFYWSRLFTEFTRDDPADRRNKLLNYGYAVVRAGVARALVAAGLGRRSASATKAQARSISPTPTMCSSHFDHLSILWHGRWAQTKRMAIFQSKTAARWRVHSWLMPAAAKIR